MEKLLNPPADERTTLGYIRTAYEKDGLIGNNPNVHLHQTNQSFSLNGTPPELQRQFFSRMLRVAERESPEKDKEDVRAEVEGIVGQSLAGSFGGAMQAFVGAAKQAKQQVLNASSSPASAPQLKPNPISKVNAGMALALSGQKQATQ